MNEDYYQGLSPAQITAVKTFNERLDRCVQENHHHRERGSYIVSFTDDIVSVLEKYFLPLGDMLHLGSKHFYIENLTHVHRVSNAVILLGDKGNAHGYLTSPCALTLLRPSHPRGSALILDNRLPESNYHRQKERATPFPNGTTNSSYLLADLIESRTPLLIFPHGAAYMSQHRLKKQIRTICSGPPLITFPKNTKSI